ncbi:MAG: flavodoxin [Anaerolineae bacterium]|nr:flavodoxin [Anaerolineae bacterium]
MGKIGLFYGSNTGNTEFIAFQIKEAYEKLDPGSVDVFNIGASSPEQILKYTYLIFGIPTWNTGELQDDWAAFWPKLGEMNFTGKKIAIFGLGDQNGYGFNFLDAAGMLADEVMKQGAELLGLWETNTYEFAESKANVEDHFLSLGIDQDGQSGMTPARITKWVKRIKTEFGI